MRAAIHFVRSFNNNNRKAHPVRDVAEFHKQTSGSMM